MSTLRNTKHEIYCQHRANGDNRRASAIAAGYSPKSAAPLASRLDRQPDIQTRIKEIQERGSERAVSSVAISKEWVLTELVVMYEMAKRKQLITPANRSLELIGKELGMFQDVIPREIFSLMMAAMGTSVTRYVTDSAVLEQIIADWERISIAEPRQLKAGVIPGAQTSKPADPSDHNQ